MKDKQYTRPYDRQVEILQESRRKKTQDQDFKARVAEEVTRDNPDVSKEKTTATVFKMVALKKLQHQQERIYGVTEESFRPDVKATLKKRLVKQHKHDGCYQYNEALDKEIWSCCASEDKGSKGCIVTYKDLDKWQTLSF